MLGNKPSEDMSVKKGVQIYGFCEMAFLALRWKMIPKLAATAITAADMMRAISNRGVPGTSVGDDSVGLVVGVCWLDAEISKYMVSEVK
jgi:hypothetical protein